MMGCSVDRGGVEEGKKDQVLTLEASTTKTIVVEIATTRQPASIIMMLDFLFAFAWGSTGGTSGTFSSVEL
jgi:hypothetical protein